MHWRKQFLGRAAMIVAVSIWGSTFAVTKIALAELGPFSLAAIRFGLAALLLLLTNLASLRGRRLPVRQLALSGFLGVTLFCGLQNLGLRHTSAASAGLILGSIPAFTLIVSAIALKERVSMPRTLGAIASIFGTSLIVLKGGAQPGVSTITGNVLILSAAISWAVYTVKSKALLEQLPQPLVTAASMGFGFLFLAPVAVYEVARFGIRVTSMETAAAVGYLSVVASGVAYSLWNYGLRSVSAAEAGVITNLSAVVSVLTAAVILGEAVTPSHLAGGALVIAGVYLAGRGPRHDTSEVVLQKLKKPTE